MRDYLSFQLYGPLSAWGDIAVGETRPSTLAPSKSAVLGLLAAALGLRRPDTTPDATLSQQWETQHLALANGYGMAVKLTQPGLPLTDFHTAEVPRGTGYLTRRDEIVEVSRQKRSGIQFKGTIPSRRDYRQDAYAAVALWARAGAPHSLAELRDALLAPVFTLYLGRKSCPLALPLMPVVASAENIETALADFSFAASAKQIWGNDPQTAERVIDKMVEDSPMLFWDADAETCIPDDQWSHFVRRDHPASRRRWQFSVRDERQAHWPAGT